MSVPGMGLGWGLPIVRLIRPLNAVLAAVGVLAGMQLATQLVAVPLPQRLGAPVAAFLITGFGNVLNDLRDVEVDRQAHPRRPLPSGTVTRRAATNLAAALASMGLAASALAGLAPFAFALATMAVLLLYEARLKRGGLGGNIAVAGLTAATFVFGAVAAGQPWAFWAWVAAGMAFFVNLAREVAKDMQDMDADRGHRLTFPMQVGTGSSALVVLACASVGVVASVPFLLEGKEWMLSCDEYRPAAGFVLLADIAAAVGGFAAFRSARASQRILKVAMALALLGFLLWGSVVDCGL